MDHDAARRTPDAAPGAARRWRGWLIGAGALLVCAAPGCATSNTQALEQQIQRLELRVAELERTHRHFGGRLDEHERAVELLEDRVRSLRLTEQRQARADGLPTVRIGPDTRPRREARAIYPSEAQALDGLEGDGEGSAPPEGYIEIVVSDEQVREYTGRSVHDAPRQRASHDVGPRRAQEDVVHGERLPVMAMDGAGRAAAPAPAAVSGDALGLYKRGLEQYRSGDFTGAVASFGAFLDADPAPEYVDNALYWLGDAHYGLGDYARAASYFHRIVQEHPDANKVPDALLKVGLTYQKLGKPESAREVLDYLIEAFPRSEAARIAREKLGEA